MIGTEGSQPQLGIASRRAVWICLIVQNKSKYGELLLLPRGAGHSRAFVAHDSAQDTGTGRWQLGLAFAISTPGLSQPGSSINPFPQHQGHEGTTTPWSTTLGWGPECSPTNPKWATVLSYREEKRQQQRLLWPWCFLSLVEWDCQSSTPRAPSPSCCTENQHQLTWFQPVFLHD